MMFLVKKILILVFMVCFSGVAQSQETAVDWIKRSLNEELNKGVCGERLGAIEGTLNRIENLNLPNYGKVLIVNIPSGVITAYTDGNPVIESRVAVGKEQTRTPQLDTEVTFVRPNPTWTVPESILKRKNWREKLAKNPRYFENANFKMELNGKLVSPEEASNYADQVDKFIQQPGDGNALGRLKIAIANSNGVYLHDTNEPEVFDESVRAASSGCIRIQDFLEVAAWILDTTPDDIKSMIDNGDIKEYKPKTPVRVILGYWTAWPDLNGEIQVFPDIYNIDNKYSECRYDSVSDMNNDKEKKDDKNGIWSEYELR